MLSEQCFLCWHLSFQPIASVTKGKAIQVQAKARPDVSLHDAEDYRHMEGCNFVIVRTGRLYTQNIFLILVYVKD